MSDLSIDALLEQLNKKEDKPKIQSVQKTQPQNQQNQPYQIQQQNGFDNQQHQQIQQQMPLYQYMPQQVYYPPQIPQQNIYQQYPQPIMQPVMQYYPQPQYVAQQIPQQIQQQPQQSINYFVPAPPVQQQQVKHAQQRKLTPEESERIDVDKIYIDPEKQWQLHISQLPLEVTQQEIQDVFQCYGEIKDISTFPQKNYAFVNFKTKKAAMEAFQNVDQISIRGEKIKLQSSHNELQIILRRIPIVIQGREMEFISCLKRFLEFKEKDLFCHIQVEKAGTLYSAYLHFLTKAESKNAFSYLRTIDFTKYCNEQMHLVEDYEHAIYITNQQVEERVRNNQQTNQDKERELCQFMCLRFVKETTTKQTKQVQQVQQYQIQNVQQPENNVVVYKNSVYLTKIPTNIKEQQIRQLMEQFGIVKEVRIISTKQSETNCNCAVVKFVQESEANKAKEAMHITTADGQTIKIQPHIKKN